MNLIDNELSGEIPPELGNLKNLVKLETPNKNEVERGDPAGAGQPQKPGKVETPHKRVERGDPAGVGQPSPTWIC